jgi:hypothetical protein
VGPFGSEEKLLTAKAAKEIREGREATAVLCDISVLRGYELCRCVVLKVPKGL